MCCGGSGGGSGEGSRGRACACCGGRVSGVRENWAGAQAAESGGRGRARAPGLGSDTRARASCPRDEGAMAKKQPRQPQTHALVSIAPARDEARKLPSTRQLAFLLNTRAGQTRERQQAEAANRACTPAGGSKGRADARAVASGGCVRVRAQGGKFRGPLSIMPVALVSRSWRRQ